MRVITVALKAGCLLYFSGVPHSVRGVEPKAGAVSDSPGQPSTTILAAGMDDLELKRRSQLWYVLSRDNGSGLLQGLPQRLGKVIVPSRRKDPVWQGVDGGGSVKLVIERDSDAEGEIFVGFFAGPRWWLAEPVQARIFDEPGDRLVFVVDRLPPGEYWIGAMVGGLPTPKALGVHRTWPAPITVGAGKANAELRISTKFSEVSASGRTAEGHAGQWPQMDPTRMVAVRTVDRAGAPIPFCDITLIERDPGLPSRIKWFRHIGTDERGQGYCDELAGPFSVDSQRFDFDPWQLAARSQYHHETQIRDLATSKNITVTMDDFPTGTCKITGRVHDAAGNAVTGFFLSVNRVDGFEIERFVGPLPGDVESHIQRTQVPIMDDDGKFALDGLAPGDYAIEAWDFDALRHVYLVNKPHVHLAEPSDEAVADVELESREARYGRAIFGDGKPVTHGYWIAPFNQPGTAKRGRSMNFMSDGSFRVLLSKSECEGLRENAKGVIELYSRDKGIQAKKAAKAEIRFDDLSSDPQRPTTVVVRERDEMPAAVAAPLKPNQKWKLALGDSPDFKLVDTKGQTRRLADYRGKVVWLNVFGTGCAPCLQEWPHLVELSQQHGAEGLVVLAICPQPAKEVEEFARLRSPPFPVLVDEHQDVVARIINPGLLVLPSNLLIDRDGRIAHLSEDFTDVEFAELTAKARKLLTREP